MNTPPDPQAIALLYREIFEVDVRGRRVLEHLERVFASKQPCVTEGGIDAVLKTYQRSAHRELLDFIHMQLDRANGQERPQNPEAQTGATP